MPTKISTEQKQQKRTLMKAAVLTELANVYLEDCALPQINDNEVLIKIEAVGICGSDVHYFTHGHIGDRYVQYPHIQGHECSGVVADIGKNVQRFDIGDRVAIEPGVSCMSCEWCKEGKYNLCPDVQFLSTPPVKGAFVQYLAHKEEFLYKIPDALSFEIATLAEPLSVGIHAVRRGNIKPGSTVLITGMGPVGLLTIIAAKYYGADQIIVTDIEANRLKVAEKLGATEAVNIDNTNIDEIIHQYSNNKGVDAVIETSGNGKAISSSLQLIKRGGCLVSVGFPAKKEVPLDITYMLQNEIDLHTVYRYVNTYPDAIKILNNLGKEITHMITDYYSMDNIQKAMEKAYQDKENTIKVIVYPNK